MKITKSRHWLDRIGRIESCLGHLSKRTEALSLLINKHTDVVRSAIRASLAPWFIG
ncbi:hypothetical protein EMIT048CA2_160136 [Pseudomonas chlororaphis]